MLSIGFLFEGTPKGYLEKGKVDIPKTNQAFFKRIFAVPSGLKRQKLMKAQMKMQSRVNNMPSSIR